MREVAVIDISTIFKNKTLDEDKLIAYGFSAHNKINLSYLWNNNANQR